MTDNGKAAVAAPAKHAACIDCGEEIGRRHAYHVHDLCTECSGRRARQEAIEDRATPWFDLPIWRTPRQVTHPDLQRLDQEWGLTDGLAGPFYHTPPVLARQGDDD